MEIKDGYVIALGAIVFGLAIYSLININSFIPIEKKCETGFQIMNKCKCIPDSGLANLFGRKYLSLDGNINITSDGNMAIPYWNDK